MLYDLKNGSLVVMCSLMSLKMLWKKWVPHTWIDLWVGVSGCLVASFLVSLFKNPDTTKTIVETLQAVVIIFATIFTAWWTSKTFGYKERDDQVREAISALNRLVNAIGGVQAIIEIRSMDNELIQSKSYKKMEAERIKKYNDLMHELREIAFSGTALKIQIKNKLLELSENRFHSSNEPDTEMVVKKLSMVMTMLTNESSFDVGQEFKRLKKKLGF